MSWKWPQASRSPATAKRLLEQRAHHAADRRSPRCRPGRRGRRRRRARPAPGAAPRLRLDPALDRAAEGGADADLDQAARAGGVARGADAADLGHHLVGRLAQVGQAVRVAGRQRQQHQRRRRCRSRARRPSGWAPAPRRPGPAASSRSATSSAVSASCGSRRAGTKEPTSISRWPAACAARIHSSLCCGGQHAGDALQAVAQADFAHGDAVGWCLMALHFRRSHGEYTSAIFSVLAFQSGTSHPHDR